MEMFEDIIKPKSKPKRLPPCMPMLMHVKCKGYEKDDRDICKHSVISSTKDMNGIVIEKISCQKNFQYVGRDNV